MDFNLMATTIRCNLYIMMTIGVCNQLLIIMNMVAQSGSMDIAERSNKIIIKMEEEQEVVARVIDQLLSHIKI